MLTRPRQATQVALIFCTPPLDPTNTHTHAFSCISHVHVHISVYMKTNTYIYINIRIYSLCICTCACVHLKNMRCIYCTYDYYTCIHRVTKDAVRTGGVHWSRNDVRDFSGIAGFGSDAQAINRRQRLGENLNLAGFIFTRRKTVRVLHS